MQPAVAVSDCASFTRALGNDGRARLRFFHNREKDSIFSQANIYTLVKNYQNIDDSYLVFDTKIVYTYTDLKNRSAKSKIVDTF